MTIKLTKGVSNKHFFISVKNIEKATRRGIRRGFDVAGVVLTKEASNEILRGKKTGRVYQIRARSGRKRKHRSSAPGESHANITGKTRRSIGYKLNGAKQLRWGYGVTEPTTAHAKFLEGGTRRMKPRPSLRNAIRKKQGQLVVDFQREIMKASKKR